MMQYLKMIAQHANSWTRSSHYVCCYCLSPLLPCFWKLFCITAQATYLCWSRFEVFCQHEPIMKLKVSKRPGIHWGKHCTLEREGSRMPHPKPSAVPHELWLFLFGNRDSVKLQSTPHSQQDTICQYLSHSESLKHYWSQRIQSPRFLAAFEIASFSSLPF